MKLERSKVSFPLWRKKVDASLFHYKGTTIPGWACHMWHIDENFNSCTSKRNINSKVAIEFEKEKYSGWVTCAKQGRKTPAYRLWFSEDLQYKIKDIFLMSFMRDIEYRLRNDKTINIEDEIAFWEFLDIEYDDLNRIFLFTAYYKQKAGFPELFKRMLGSPTLHKIDDELSGKGAFRIYMQEWKPREALDYELEVDNALYTLIDTKNKLLYIGEANKLVKRLRQEHTSIKNWNYYRYNVLPNTISSEQRVMLERMLIRDLASLVESKSDINHLIISEYRLTNEKIESRYV